MYSQNLTLMKRVYFDNAATTAVAPEVVEAMLPLFGEYFGNPSSIHTEGRKVRALIEQARKSIAEKIGASIGEIFFTSGGTEANNMALKCAVRDLEVKRIISSPVEHHCVLHTVERLELEGVQVDYVKVDDKGRPDAEHLKQLLESNSAKTLVSLMHANNEIGTMIDLGGISALCEEYGAYFHSDTVQTVGHFPIDVNQTKISFLSAGAHKFHGPKGVGFIYINGDNIIKPYIDGGSQERNMRAGTENVSGIIGMAKALEIACVNMESYEQQIRSLRDYMAMRLREHVPDIEFNGDLEGEALYTVLSASFPASDKSDLLLLSLDIAGVSVSGGSACSSGADVGSHVISALKKDPSRKTVRFSFSHYNTKAEVDFVIEKLMEILPVEVAVKS